MPKYIDIHSHVNFHAFDEDRGEAIKRALDSGTWMINVGTQIDTSRTAVEIANQYKEGVYAIIGLHPIHTGVSYHDEKELGEGGKEFASRGEIFDKESYRKLLQDKKVVGIGECGLDYYRCTEESIAKQKNAFIEQIELANEFDKPLMLHIRNNPKKIHPTPTKVGAPLNEGNLNAYTDALEILKIHSKVNPRHGGARGNVHFFAGTSEEARGFLDFGFTLSFTGVITFTHDYDEVIKNTPLDMIMSETDSPYVAPVPHRGKRNEPFYVSEVVKKIAKIKNLPEAEVAEAIMANARRLFNI
ncbi:MAG: TatD family hydrolase [Candidatus Paceibacterota bacterium]|jgi:TatD DNase family protein